MNHDVIEITDILDVEKHVEGLKVIIFDLDDTLYSEKDYVRSGYREIAAMFPQIENAEEKLWKHFLNNKPAIDEFLKQEKIYSKTNKEICTQAYCFHLPKIQL